MIRSAAVARIKRGLGFRTDQDDNIIYALQEEQRLLEMGVTLPWFLVEENASFSVSIGDGGFNLPDGFIRPLEEDTLRIRPAGQYVDFKFLERKEFAYAFSRYTNTDTGMPAIYVLRKDTVLLRPFPQADYTLFWDYYKHADSLASDIENAWLANAPEVLVGGAGLRMALDLRDSDAVKIFTSMQADAKTKLFKETIAREEAARYRYKGG